MNILRINLDSAIATARMAMRIERDKRDWLKQAIEQGRRIVTEEQKRIEMARIAERAAVAERQELPHTARSWRELHLNVGVRPAAEIIFAANRAGNVDPTRE